MQLLRAPRAATALHPTELQRLRCLESGGDELAEGACAHRGKQEADEVPHFSASDSESLATEELVDEPR